MTVAGRVQNGVVVLNEGHSLPEGASVSVIFPVDVAKSVPRQGTRVKFPLVHSKNPGSLPLTSDRIAEILEAEDVSS